MNIFSNLIIIINNNNVIETPTNQGSSSSSKIKLYVDGQLRPTKLEIDDEEFDREQLANEILSAIQDARNKYEDNISEKVKTLYNNFDINYNYDVNDHSHDDLWM